jgi:DNA polymerase-3 subunit beta
VVKISAAAGPLTGALSLAAMAAVRNKKTDAPVAIAAADGMVSFSCCGLGIMIKSKVEADVAEPGHEVVSADRLAALVAGFSAGSTITLSSATNALTIAGGAAKYRLPLYYDPPAALAIDSEIASIEMSAPDFLRLLDVVVAAGTEQTRFMLRGVNRHNIGARLYADATDGVRLLRDNVVAGDFATDTDHRLIVPTRAVTLLQRLIKSTKAQQVTLRRERRLFAVTAPSFEFVTQLVDGVYPDVTRVIPAATSNVVTCARADLTAALIRAAAVADGEQPLGALAWDDGGPLRIFLPRQPNDVVDCIVAEAIGAARLALSLPQLAAMIGNFDCDQIRLAADGDGPLVLRGDGEKLGVLMGCRWNFNEGTKESKHAA